MSNQAEQSTSKRAMVISGGGSRGAWGVGVANGLTNHLGHQYDMIFGNSTGSLMGPLVLVNQFERLTKAYTSVTQKDIFNVNPFRKNGKIDFICVALRLIGGKSTLGETENLKKLINEFITEEVYEQIRQEGKLFGATCTSLTKSRSEVKNTNNETYNDMVEWIWASANQPVFMSTLHKNGEAWVDGGIKDFAPICEAIEQGADEIDVIIHNTQALTDTQWQQEGNFFNLLLRTIDLFSADVGEDNIESAKLKVRLDGDITLTFYFMTADLVAKAPNSLIFNRRIMTELLHKGLTSLIDGSICKVVFKANSLGFTKQ